MRPAGIDVIGIVVRFNTLAGLRVGSANGRHTIMHGDAVRSGVSAKILVERAVLLHDDDDVLDL
jgi:hypothetical protein